MSDDTAIMEDVASSSVPLGVQPSPPSAVQEFESFAGEYKDKGWYQTLLKASDPKKEMARQFDNAQSLIGARQQPTVFTLDENSTPEQIKAYRRQFGVPEDVTGYTIEPVKWGTEDAEVGEFINTSRSQAYIDRMKAAALEAGVPAKAFAKLAEASDKAMAEEFRGYAKQDAADDVEIAAKLSKAWNDDFEEVSTRWFGDRKNQVLAQGRHVFESTFSPQEMAVVNQLDNDALVPLAALAFKLNQKFGREDGFSQQGISGAPGYDEDQMRAHGMKLMDDPAYKDPFSPGHDAAKAKVTNHYAEIGKLRKQGR